MRWRAVVLDLDDTIIVEEAHARSSLRAAVRAAPGGRSAGAEEVALEAVRAIWRSGPEADVAVRLGIASWEALWSRFEGCHPSLDGLARWAPTYRHEAWRAALSALGGQEAGLAAEMATSFEAAQRAGHPMQEGAEELVREVAESYRTGLLTNGPADIQRLKLAHTGLADCFDTVVISGEAGVGKPSREVFALVLHSLGTEPQDAVMVGDSWERDIEGALGAGMSAIWVSAGRPMPAPAPGVAVISSIRELRELLF